MGDTPKIEGGSWLVLRPETSRHLMRLTLWDKSTVALVNVAGGQIGRHTFEAGWRWSECTQPVVGTGSCEVEHIDYAVAGTLHVKYTTVAERDLVRGKRLLDFV